MIIAIASTRGPKVQAARNVLQSIGRYLSPSPVEFMTYEVDGGVDMPRSLEQLLRGAEERVVRLQKKSLTEQRHADYFIGMEGGFHSIHHRGKEYVYLQSWAYVSNGTKGFFGSSGNVLVPDRIVIEVMRKNRELGEVIDEVASQCDVRSKQGTWGILTKDLVERQASFETALLTAFAPFYNPTIYNM